MPVISDLFGCATQTANPMGCLGHPWLTHSANFQEDWPTFLSMASQPAADVAQHEAKLDNFFLEKIKLVNFCFLFYPP